MKEILSGIYQMTLTLKGFGSGSVNTYLIRDNDKYLIIDTGWDAPESMRSMDAQLADASISFSKIKRVLLTHCHIDHLGMISRFKQLNNANIYIHQDELDLIRIRYNEENIYWIETDNFLRRHGMPESELDPIDPQFSVQGPLIAPDILLQGGEVISAGEYSLRVIPTPGHTPGHISLYEPRKKLLFSGDVLLPTILTNAAGHIQHMPNPLQQYLNSLNVLRGLEIDLVLPGHEHVFSGHQKRIDEITRIYQQKILMAAKIINVDRQFRTAYDVAVLLPWTPRIRTVAWNQLKSLNKRFALLQTIALLEELVRTNKISCFSQDGKVYYQPDF
jgi:glyoxylase-like metal-dependent hydrolase (beta-lactamase superfamily II)